MTDTLSLAPRYLSHPSLLEAHLDKHQPHNSESMPVPFQITLELASIVKPFIQGALAVASLTLAERIHRAGSDLATEQKLEVFLGRHRIDPIVDFHFRQAVQKSNQTLLSQCLEMTLESGSGPTVQEALKNPASFSTIVQLSALAFAHNHDGLANGIVNAAEKILQTAGVPLGNAPDYGSLVLTIMACQQQTAAFHWSFAFEDIERKILSAIRLEGEPSNFKAMDIVERSLPFPVLQSFLMWLKTVQSLPEHRLLHVRCNSGISTAVIWCHYILGLDVLVRVEGVDIKFGDGAATVVIMSISSLLDAGVSLLDASCPDEPLFTLSSNMEDIIISCDIRADAYGFGKKILELLLPDDEMSQEMSAHWIISQGCNLLQEDRPMAYPIHLPYLRKGILAAGAFLFAINQDDTELIRAHGKDGVVPYNALTSLREKSCLALVALMISFARIPSLKDCARMPLSIDEFLRLQEEDSGLFTDNWTSSTYPEPSKYVRNNIASYRLLSMLLLGRPYSKDYIWPSCLVSSRGWSVILDAVDAKDPDHVLTETVHVLSGVPARRGVAKRRILNGPTVMWAHMSGIEGRQLAQSPHLVTLFPGELQVESGPLLVGQEGQASISAIQTFRIQHPSPDHSGGKLQLGLQEMHELCTRFYRLPPCQCAEVKLTLTSMAGKSTDISLPKNEHEPSTVLSFLWERKWPENASLADSNAHVVVARANYPLRNLPHVTDIWFFTRARTPATRWAQLMGLCYPNFKRDIASEAYSHYRKDSECCFPCALRMIVVNRAVTTQTATSIVLV